MAPQEPIRKRPAGPGPTGEIPDKLYFRIGEVAKLCGVAAYVLRFWEGEFPQLKPNKGGTGQRLYRRRDVEIAMRIKSLLYDEGYTIPGARQAIKTEMRAGKETEAGADNATETVDARHLEVIRKELREILVLLSKPATPRTTVQPIRAPKATKPDPPPPMEFPKPKLIQGAKAKDSLSTAYIHSLFDDFTPNE